MEQKLGKNPQDYPNKDSMPQVQVALREIAAGRPVRVNDVMGYIVTMGSEETKGDTAPKRAYKFQDVIKPNSELQPDIDYYLYKQIFPPIERLCAPIPGTDSVRLAECLGLDTRKYAINTSSGSDNKSSEIFPLESQIPDSTRFADASRFTLRCRTCKNISTFGGLIDSTDLCTPNGLICPVSDCGQIFSSINIVCQLESQIREQTSRYYEGWLVCSDETCGKRTRQMSVYGSRCLGPMGRADGQCRGRMSYEYTEKKLYNQLLYFASLFDSEKIKNGLKDGKIKLEEADKDKKDRILVLAETNLDRFAVSKGVVDAYLRKCGRQWVEMDTLFGYALR